MTWLTVTVCWQSEIYDESHDYKLINQNDNDSNWQWFNNMIDEILKTFITSTCITQIWFCIVLVHKS